jgi:hypothetical protein
VTAPGPGLTHAALLSGCLTLLGCPETAQPAPTGPCSALGERCQFAPGKLGSCVIDDHCDRENCFVCQSQH